MKNKLFLVALATVTVLGPSLATPHHQTVHATNVSPAGTCTHPAGDSSISVCWEDTTKDTPVDPTTTNCDTSLNCLWETIKGWWTQVKSWFSSFTASFTA